MQAARPSRRIYSTGVLKKSAIRDRADRELAGRLPSTAALLRAPDPDTARAILTPDRYAGIEVHSWQFGGRPP